MSPMGPRHLNATQRIMRLMFGSLSANQAIIFAQGPILLHDESEPEPDIFVVRPGEDRYAGRLPTADDVLLLIEVADSTLAFDLTTKAVDYAQAGVIEYWVVDVKSFRVVVHRGPQSGGSWGSVESVGVGHSLTPVSFPELKLAIEAMTGTPAV